MAGPELSAALFIPATSFPTFGGEQGEDVELFLLEFDNVCDSYDLPPDDSHQGTESQPRTLYFGTPLQDEAPEEEDLQIGPNSSGGEPSLRLKYLRRALKKEAARHLSLLGPEFTCTYSMLKAALVQRFLPRESASLYRAELRGRQRRHRETLLELASSIRVATQRAYPDASANTVDELAKETFIDALDDTMREKVQDSDPSSLDAAVKRALVVEANIKRDRKAKSVAKAEAAATVAPLRPSADIDDKTIERIAQRVAEILSSKERTEGRRSVNPPCVHCGRENHRSEFCWQRRRDDGNFRGRNQSRGGNNGRGHLNRW